MVIALKTSTATAITYTNCCGALFKMAKLKISQLPEHKFTSDDIDEIMAFAEAYHDHKLKLLGIADVSNSDCKHRFQHVEEMAVVVCTDCKEILGRKSDC